ncbi:hypothetical protein C4D60_Mb11t06090 [Musa balbisiana]|uniref:Uncharacterized protein n=1 Tax=Musa balbisiana TaxID=52838 RepID=A0A4S8J3K6_MUSBA|nr:hypothetical protein C4D60_Mb11t06090 [Musa balbisiana]
MEVAFSSPRLISGDARILSRSSRSSGRPAPKREALSRPPSASAGVSSSSSSRSSSLSCGLVAAPFVCGSVLGDFNGLNIRVPSLKPPALSHGRRPTRGVVTMVIPFLRGNAWEQPPPDLASYLYKN